jgi:hypothetical protein
MARSLAVLAAGRTFRILLFAVTNFLVFINVGLNTLVTPSLLASLYALPVVCTWLYIKPRNFKMTRRILWLGSACSVVSVLLLVNYYGSSHPQVESYHIGPDFPRPPRSTLITLEGYTYDEFPGMRLFANFGEMANARHITYTIEEGALGFRVVKDYAFSEF